LKPLFPGKTEIDELDIIFTKMGTPNDVIWPGYSSLPHCQKFSFTHHEGTNWAHAMVSNAPEHERDLVTRCLVFDPARRIMAREALRHSFFSEAPEPQKFVLTPELINSFPNAVHTS